ncbi:hypothetical protein N9L48_05155 [Psychrosphaera sp.]|nr:hypothetical protein [Psychrosphaera sp.]
MKFVKQAFFVLLISTSLFSYSNELYSPNGDVVRVVSSLPLEFNSGDYYSELLHLALSKTQKEYGPYKIQYVNSNLVQERALHELNSGNSFDVYWSVSTKVRETFARPIRVPLLRGLIGYRVSLILKDRLSEFKSVNSDIKFKEFAAGQGHDWPDFDILKANKFSIFPASLYESLIDLLALKRIDHFPRGLNELIREVELLNDNRFTIEPNFILQYPSYEFFFVALNNTRLANRIEKGLLLAQEDGSFDEVFERFVRFEKIYDTLKLGERQVIEINNSFRTTKPIKGKRPISDLSQLINTQKTLTK